MEIDMNIMKMEKSNKKDKLGFILKKIGSWMESLFLTVKIPA